MITITDQFYKILETLIMTNQKKKNGLHKCGRKKSQPISHYCKVIMKVLSTGCQWNSLTEILHYSIYNKFYLYLVDNKIIEEFHYLLTIMNIKLNNINGNFYIDTSIIRNMLGTEDVSFNYKIKSKKGTNPIDLVT